MPPVVLERPKMSRPMWDALKGHIMRERQRKKQELEADAEVERQRKERERQQKQHVLTLSETREQITQSESRLAELKEEKHQLFLQLKKVLNEDETRKRQLMSQESNEMFRLQQFNNYNNPPRIQLGEHSTPSQTHHHPSQMFLQPIQLSRAPPTSAPVFKVGPPPPVVSHHNSSPHSSIPITIKRSRTPSPPPQQQSHNYKFGPFKPPPQAIPQYAHTAHSKPSMGLQYFHPQSQVSQAPPSQPAPLPPPQQHSQHGNFSSHPTSAGPPSTLYTYAGAPPSRSPQQPSREESQKHQQVAGPPMFIHHGSGPLPRSYVIHQSVEHPNSSPHKYSDDGPKYYPPPSHGLGLRAPSHLSLHPGLTIQSSQNVPSGSITSGFPIRTQPNVSAYQGRPPSPHVAYSVPGGPPRLTYGHPHGQVQVPQHPGVQRYSLPPGVQRD